MKCLFFQASTIKVTFPRTVVVNKVLIVNVRATAQDHVRDHPCHPPHGRQRGSKEVEDHGHVPPRRQNGSSRGQQSRHSQRENDRPRSPSRSPLPPPSRSTEGVRRRGGSRSRPPRRRNGSSCVEQSRHSQRENDRPRSPSRSPLPPPSRSTEEVRRRGGSRSRPPRRRNGSSCVEQSRHSQRENDRPRSPSRSPLPPPSRST